MLANDDALDAVAGSAEALEKVLQHRYTLARLFRDYSTSYPDDDLGILGLAQVLVNRGVSFDEETLTLLAPFLGKALLESSTWGNPSQRRSALIQLTRQLNGEAPWFRKKFGDIDLSGDIEALAAQQRLSRSQR